MFNKCVQFEVIVPLGFERTHRALEPGLNVALKLGVSHQVRLVFVRLATNLTAEGWLFVVLQTCRNIDVAFRYQLILVLVMSH